MRIALTLDDDVLAAARQLATGEQRSLGSVMSDLARRGLAQARVETTVTLPVVRVPAGSGLITPEMVKRALGDD